MRAVAPAISPDDTSSRPEFAMPQGAEIVVAGLAKDFAGVSVLHGVDLRIPAGQFLAVVGRSGSGKTTLLRLICGLDAPSAGSIAIGGVAGPATVTTRIMFQEPRLLPWAKVIGNVEVGLGGASGPEARQRALRALQEVGLATRAGDWPAVLSGGQKQRVALARALVGRPRILAFDEPLGALDALTRIEMQALIETIWRDQGFTAVLVTHDVGEALALADRIVLIDHGAIALDLAVDLPRPRRRGSAEVAALEGIVLGALFGESRSERTMPVV